MMQSAFNGMLSLTGGLNGEPSNASGFLALAKDAFIQHDKVRRCPFLLELF